MCREYPPAAYPPGGIGTYARHITVLLAEAGEIVHVIAHRWAGAPDVREESVEGRLVVHRVALDDASFDKWAIAQSVGGKDVPQALLASSFPSQAFSWQAALLAERLIEDEGIDVIEAQEWEAPLYYFQLRRALNLGPARRPPCVVHLHSPTQQIFAANDWDTTVADYDPAVALEEYSLTAADSLLCPSHFLADQVLARYRVDPSILSIIPYPLGESPHLDRDAQTWATGSVCHIGRLELRKGIFEWADAVSMVALDHPELHVDFVGGDTPVDATGGATVGDAVRARVPRRIRHQFHFHGVRDRHGVLDLLSRARAAVVPSRWENFPYSCIESMSSGLPVIVSPNGGMREMVADGNSGWIAADSTPAGLATALRRALDTPAARWQQMGNAAAATIRRICNNDAIVKRHLEVKRRLVSTRACLPVPAAPSVQALAGFPAAGLSSQASRTVPPRRGMGVVVTCSSSGLLRDSCVSSIRAQTERPAAVCVIGERPTSLGTTICAAEGWQVIPPGQSLDDAEMTAAKQLVLSDRTLIGLAFVDSRARLEPEFLSTCSAAFAQDERLGILSAWTRETGPRNQVRIQPNPTVPYLWHAGMLAQYVAVRVAALEDAIDQLDLASDKQSRRRVLDTVVERGWIAVTYPAVLGSITLDRKHSAPRRSAVRYSSMARAVQRLHTPFLRWLLACSPEDRRAVVGEAFSNPARSVRWLLGHVLHIGRGAAVTTSDGV